MFIVLLFSIDPHLVREFLFKLSAGFFFNQPGGDWFLAPCCTICTFIHMKRKKKERKKKKKRRKWRLGESSLFCTNEKGKKGKKLI